MVEENTLKNNKKLCECGCGTPVRNRFKRAHQFRKFIGEKHYNWKGGRRLHKGYWQLHMRDYYRATKAGYVYEHIYFYEQYHKLCMLPWGDVHHKDDNRKNNMIWNLQGMMHKHHIGNHKIGNKNGVKDMSNRFCLLCNSRTTTENKKEGYFYWYKHENGHLCNICYARKKRYERLSRLD